VHITGGSVIQCAGRQFHRIRELSRRRRRLSVCSRRHTARATPLMACHRNRVGCPARQSHSPDASTTAVTASRTRSAAASRAAADVGAGWAPSRASRREETRRRCARWMTKSPTKVSPRRMCRARTGSSANDTAAVAMRPTCTTARAAVECVPGLTTGQPWPRASFFGSGTAPGPTLAGP
jgi:hypothetical protein